MTQPYAHVSARVVSGASVTLFAINLGLALFHGASAVVMMALIQSDGGDRHTVPVAATFWQRPGWRLSYDTYSVSLQYACIAFLLMAACDHALVASLLRGWYDRAVASGGVNHARWTEYTASLACMSVVIGVLCGAVDA
jgi:hypothetical protein